MSVTSQEFNRRFTLMNADKDVKNQRSSAFISVQEKNDQSQEFGRGLTLMNADKNIKNQRSSAFIGVQEKNAQSTDKLILNAFSVDLEDWFQGLTSTNPQIERWPSLESRVLGATKQLLDILRQYRVQATFFVLGYVADQHPQLIEAIVADGHEIGIHGYYHRFVHRLTADEFRRELEICTQAVMRITGQQPVGHRAPYFSINAQTPWAFDCLAEQGLRYDSSVFPTRNLLYGFPGAPRFPYKIAGSDLVEFPISTLQVRGVSLPFAGGFYLRSLPYAVIRWAIGKLQAQGQPVIFYTHPWELDTGQVYRQVTPRERITHYHGRQTLAGKFHRLFTDFRFTSIGALYEHGNY